jgi:murein L,D-transpeptidase YafK
MTEISPILPHFYEKPPKMTDKNINRRDLIMGFGALVGSAVATYALPLDARPRVRRVTLPETVIDLSGKKQTCKKDPSLQKANQRLVTQTIESTKSGNLAVVVNKLDNELFVYQNGKLQDTFEIGRTSHLGDKVQRGDYKVPEGNFYVCRKNPSSKYYRALLLSYPNAEDAVRGLQSKLITRKQHDRIINAIKSKGIPDQRTKLGGAICLHGKHEKGMLPWTAGCVALINKDMKSLYNRTGIGTNVVIVRYC